MPGEKGHDLRAALERLAGVEQRLTRLEEMLEQEAPARPPAELSVSERAPQDRTNLDVLPVSESESAPAPLPLPTPAPAVVNVPSKAEEPATVGLAVESLERVVGLKWAGWIGAVVVVLGTGFGIKFAYDQGWLGHLPVWVQLLAMSMVGFTLLIAGEIVYRRVDVIAAAGLFGAGIGVLFTVSYAGNAFYGTYDYQTAFVFGLLTTVLGAGVAMRGRLVSIAVLSQLGGQLAPVVLDSGQPPSVPFLVYVFMLQLVCLILALWAGTPRWWVLRGLSLAATSWWTLISLLGARWGPGLQNEVLWFALLSAAAYQGELLRSALLAGARVPSLPAASGWGTAFSLLVTTGLAAVGLHVFYLHDSAAFRGGFLLILAGICLASGFVLRSGANERVRFLKTGYVVQGLGLLLLFVPVTLTGAWISLGWAILGLAFAVLGARFQQPGPRWSSLVAWGLALLRLNFDAGCPEENDVQRIWIVGLGQSVHGYTVIGWLLAATGMVTAWLLQAEAPGARSEKSKVRQWWALCVSLLAGFVWCVASVQGLSPLTGTLALVVWAWLLVAGDGWPQSLHLGAQALGVLVLAAGKWAIVDTLQRRVSGSWNALDQWPVLNSTMGMGLLLAGSFLAVSRLRRDTVRLVCEQASGNAVADNVASLVVVACALVVVTFGLSLEVDRTVERGAALGVPLGWPIMHLKVMVLTPLWLAAILFFALAGRRLGVSSRWPWAFLFLLGIKSLFVDMLIPRLESGSGPAPVSIVFNLEFLITVLFLAGMVALRRLVPLETVAAADAPLVEGVFHLLALLIVLFACTLEVDRAVAGHLAAYLYDPVLAAQVAISIFWSMFAIATVLVGFRLRRQLLRYFGLALFAATLLKVVALDMHEVAYGYRVLSFLGLGVLLLVTSVFYGKFSLSVRGEAGGHGKP